jgi:hypothetical protein
MSSTEFSHDSTEAATPSACSSPSPKGIEHSGVIDLLAFNQPSGEVLLTMVETRPWAAGSMQLYQLQEKLNAYLSFVLDGEMLEAYPRFAGKPVRIRLECATPPGAEETAFLQHVYEQTLLQGIAFEVEVVGESVGGCSCAG